MPSLPEDCIAKILSFTDPREACRLSIVSSEFRRAAQSDTVWETFLPPDYQSILSNSDSASLRSFPSKKQLYLSLCDITILIDDGKTSFWFDKWSGKKCFMISARGLTIIWGGTPQYWSWIADPNSRFREFAELVDVCRLEITGSINTSVLSEATNYSCHLVYKLRQGAYGFDDRHRHPQLQVAVGVVNSGEVKKSKCSVFGGKKRRDGWLEIELGEFLNEKDGDDELEVSIMEINGGHWKSGLLVKALEIRPKITANPTPFGRDSFRLIFSRFFQTPILLPSSVSRRRNSFISDSAAIQSSSTTERRVFGWINGVGRNVL